MKKHSILTKICALVSALFIAGLAGCGSTGDSGNSSSVEGGSTNSESSSTVPDSTPGDSTPDDSTPDDSTPDDSTPDDPVLPQSNLTISAPQGEVFPYVEQAKEYLQAGAGVDVCVYATKMDNPYAPVQVKWTYNIHGARKFLVEYATKADYSDALSVEVGAVKRSVDLYNLYKATNYYLRITAVGAEGEALEVQESQFQTTDLGPRVMNIGGICNVRDLGGFQTLFGKRIVQGIAYRGGALKDKNSILANGERLELTEDGKKYMSEVLGIKGELDFRTESESGIKLEDGSLIPGAQLTYLTAGSYDGVFTQPTQREVYRKIFSYFANKDNYPMYYHCTAGADRTGTVSYILHAFLGVSELETMQDYEFTSFSIYGPRGGSNGAHTADYAKMRTALNAMEGATLQEKAENYLISIGVTETELNTIKAIFFGEIEIEGKTFIPDEVNTSSRMRKITSRYSELFAAWAVQKKK